MTRADLSIMQADDYAAVVTVRLANGTPADITGYTVQAHIRRACADVDSVIAADIACTVDPPSNINIALTHDQTLPLTGMYTWDLQIVSPGGIVTTILAGRVRVAAEVTRLVVAA